MALYLVQHGKSLSKHQDPQKGLSEEGAVETRRIAEVAANYGVMVSKITHSGKQRALQTAEIMAAALKPVQGVASMDGLNPLDDPAAISATLESSANLMLVGHLPFMERLVSMLIIQALEPPVFKFQNAGIVCLDKHSDSSAWIIMWALMPNIG